MLSSVRSGRPRRLGNSAALSPSAIPTNTFREGSFGGLLRRCRVSSDRKRKARNSATTVPISTFDPSGGIKYFLHFLVIYVCVGHPYRPYITDSARTLKSSIERIIEEGGT